MKTRRILAASTAALLAFGSVAVVASAATEITVTVGNVPAKAASDDTTSSIENAVSVTAVDGSSNPVTLTKDTDYTVTVTGDAENGFTVKVQSAGSSYTFTTVEKTVAAAEGTPNPGDDGGDGTTSGEAEIENTNGKWEDLVTFDDGGSPAATIATVQYSTTKANAAKLKDLTLSAELSTADLADPTDAVYSTGALKDLKASQVSKLVTAVDTNKFIMIDFKVTEEDEDEYGDRTKFTMPAPVSINVIDLGFEAKHVYHYEDKKLVEVKVDKLTDKKETVGGVQTTFYGIQFTTKSFSPYIITKNEVKGAVALDDEANPANESGTSAAANNGTTNPDTGIALAIAPVVLAAGAVAVVALKKKH